ncbi:MAG TPA: nuclear transport factor 2 family protein [Gemmatimonadaceae bacterium]
MRRTDRLKLSSIVVLGGLGATVIVSVAMRPAATTVTATASDSAEVVKAVAQYHEALKAGDSAAAVNLLGKKAVILESGEFQTREEYVSHHLGSDIAFAKAVPSPSEIRSVKVDDDMGWVASTNRATGTFNGRAIDSNGVELMVLSKSSGNWRIEAIHWSSRRRAPAS